ncbi:hypothetical protein KRP22_002281 [Phytophthora ramorum]|nr:hypothetical protein KRP22_1564 [Phytophthora ramorum]
MIYYDASHLWGVLMRWQGSALNGQAPIRAFIMAMIALVVALMNQYYPFVVPTRASTAFTDSLTVFNTFLGLIVSFRMNSAFAQWRAGVVAVGTLSEAARDIVGSGCAYVSTTMKNELTEASDATEAEASKREDTTNNETRPRVRRPSVDFKALNIPQDILEKCTFFTELRRLVFLYIAIVFHDCRGLDGIDKLKEAGVLTDAEYDELYACGTEHEMPVDDKESYRAIVRRTPHKLRATITELWLKRLVQVATNRGHLTLPNANALQLKLARLPNLYTTVFNIANVPIPFNYMQYLQFLLTAYMLLYTFVIVPRSGLYTPLWVFMWGTFLFMADEVAMEIECPFGLDANDIDLEARLLQIEEELTVLIRSQYYFVSGGTSLTRIPEISVPERKPSLDQPKPAPLQSDFSFHQGRISASHGAMLQQGSLPEINEFTKLIRDTNLTSSSNSKSSGYGSDSAA